MRTVGVELQEFVEALAREVVDDSDAVVMDAAVAEVAAPVNGGLLLRKKRISA